VPSKATSGIDFSNLDLAMNEMYDTFTMHYQPNPEINEDQKTVSQYIDIEAIKNAILSSIEKTRQSEFKIMESDDRDVCKPIEFTLPTMHYTDDLSYAGKSQNTKYHSISIRSSSGNVRNISCRNHEYSFVDQNGVFFIITNLHHNMNVFFIEHGIFNIDDALYCLGKTVRVLHFDNRCNATLHYKQCQKIRYNPTSSSFIPDINTGRHQQIISKNISLCTECAKHSSINDIDTLINL